MAGRGSFDAALAVEKLGALFGITRIALMGGGYADGIFAAANAIAYGRHTKGHGQYRNRHLGERDD